MANRSPRFQTTLWSTVLLAAREPDSSDGREALERLCAAYWYPVYAFIRRRGASVEDAEDLAQGFFKHILLSEFLTRANPELGRFRSFLLGALRHYLGHEFARAHTQRSGGRLKKIPINATLAEYWLGAESSPENDTTHAFDRSWANTLINQAILQLEQEHTESGRQAVFDALKGFLQRSAGPGEYDTISTQLGMTKGAVAAATHRMNRRFGELVRKGVRDTVATSEMAAEEMRFLFSAMRG